MKRKYSFVNGNISCNLVKQDDICYNKKIYHKKKTLETIIVEKL